MKHLCKPTLVYMCERLLDSDICDYFEKSDTFEQSERIHGECEHEDCYRCTHPEVLKILKEETTWY